MKQIKWKKFKNIRKKAVQYFISFLLFMMFCTIVSRGIYANHMPKIEIGQAVQKSLSHTVSADGNIEAAKETAVVVKEGIRIGEICVKIGEKVEEGTVLFYLDTSDLEDLIEELNQTITVEEEKITALKAGNQAEEQNLETVQQRAKEDLSNTTKTQNEAVSNAQKAYNDAVKKLSSYPSWKNYWSETKKKDSQYQMLKNMAGMENASKEEKDEFTVYEEALELSARSAWEEGKQALENDVSVQKLNLSHAKEEKETAILQAERSVEDATKDISVDKSSIMEEENTLAYMKKLLTTYQKFLKNKGKVVSKVDGYVEMINVMAGDRTTDSAAILLADGSKGWNFKAVLTENERDSINVNDTVTVTFQNGKIKEENCPVTAINRTEQGTYEAIIKVTETNVSLGENGVLEMTSQTELYSCCIPLSALYSDNNKDYILLVRETDTILGTELSVVKREVTIRDKNESYAALEDDALGREDLFVVYSSKAIISGDKVRLVEEEDGQE